MSTAASPFQDTQFNDGWGRVATLTIDGSGLNFGVPFRAEDEQQKPLVDNWGRLYVLSSPIDPDGFNVTSQAGSGATLVSAAVITATPAKLIALAGYNSDTLNNLYVQLYNILVPPAGPVTPDIIIPVPMNKTAFSYSLPWIFTVGYVIAISTTELTYTAPAAACLHFTTIYQTSNL